MCAQLYVCVCVCGVCIYGIIGRERYVIDKLWRKKPAVLSSDLKLEAQSKARINQHRVVQETAQERVPSGQHALLLERAAQKWTVRIPKRSVTQRVSVGPVQFLSLEPTWSCRGQEKGCTTPQSQFQMPKPPKHISYGIKTEKKIKTEK